MSVLDLFRLDDKVAVITGASSGLGAGFAVSLAEAGADIVVAARRADRLGETSAAVAKTGRRVLTVRTDVTRPGDCQDLADAALREFGRVDFLVNNAEAGTAVPATRESPEQFRGVIEVTPAWPPTICPRAWSPSPAALPAAAVAAGPDRLLPRWR
jgi:NAD(P)-dependent dehydrogenase (short-subunit alcohol dehydrogenase family)